MKDIELMLRVQAGDEVAFRELMESYSRPIASFFYRLGLRREDAEDGVQDVFLRLYRSRADYVPRTEFRFYLFRIATNYWIDRIRSASRRPGSISLDAPVGGGRSSGSFTLKEHLAGSNRNPDSDLVGRELREEIEHAVSRLPAGQRVVFLLGEQAEMKYSDISRILGIPVGTVKSRMHSAVHHLREALKQVRVRND